MYWAFGRSHRRMVIRSLKNRKAILDINQSRNGFPAEEEDCYERYEVIDCICPKGDPSNSKLSEWF